MRTAAPKSNKGTQSGKKRDISNLQGNIPKSKATRPRSSDINESDDRVAADTISHSTKENAIRSDSDSKKHKPKKATTGSDIAALVNSANPSSFVQKRISKDFDGVTFFGTVTKYDDSDDPAFWHVVYDDGDDEDYNKKDLIKALKNYRINEKYDGHKN